MTSSADQIRRSRSRSSTNDWMSRAVRTASLRRAWERLVSSTRRPTTRMIAEVTTAKSATVAASATRRRKNSPRRELRPGGAPRPAAGGTHSACEASVQAP